MPDEKQPAPDQEDAHDEIAEHLDELGKKIDKLEEEALPQKPHVPGVGSMF